MKKRILLITTLLVVAAMLVFSFVACGQEQETTPKEGTCSVVLVSKQGEVQVYSVDIAELGTTLTGEAAINQIAQKHGLQVDWQESQYGKFFNSIGIVKPEAANEFVQLFTSVEKDKDVSVYATTVEYDGKTLTSSAFGITQMSVEKDCIIYIRVGSY